MVTLRPAVTEGILIRNPLPPRKAGYIYPQRHKKIAPHDRFNHQNVAADVAPPEYENPLLNPA